MTLYSYSSKISDVVKPEQPLPEDQDQLFDVSLLESGALSIRFYKGDGSKALVSRLSLPLKSAQAVEVFCEPGKDYWLMRVNGNQVPLVLPTEECEKLMNAVDSLV